MARTVSLIWLIGVAAAVMADSAAPAYAQIVVGGQCGKCGTWYSGSSCPKGCQRGQDPPPPPPPPADTYGVVSLRNKTGYEVSYIIRSSAGGGWTRKSLDLGEGRYHWNRPGDFEIRFSSGGSTKTYRLEANTVRAPGRDPTFKEGRQYEFRKVAGGIDLKKGSSTPASTERPASPFNVVEGHYARLAGESFSNAETAYNRGDFATAEREFAAVFSWVESWPKLEAIYDTPRYRQMYAKAQEEMRPFRAAKAAYQEGEAAKARGDTTSAERHFRRALSHVPDYFHAKMALDLLLSAKANQKWLEKERLAKEKAEREAKERAEAEQRLKEKLAEREKQKGNPVSTGNLTFPGPASTQSSTATGQAQMHPLSKQPAADVENYFELNDPLLAKFLIGGRGPAEPTALEDPQLAMLLSGNYSAKADDDRTSKDPEAKDLLGPGFIAGLKRAQRHYELLQPLDMKDLLKLNQGEAYMLVGERYLAKVVEANRDLSTEWAAEMRRLEESGLIGPGESRVEKERSDPKYAAALKASFRKVRDQFENRKRRAEQEGNEHLADYVRHKQLDPKLSQDTTDAIIRITWEASKKLRAAQERADRESIDVYQDLVRQGVLKSGVPLEKLRQEDAAAVQVIDRYLVPIRDRLWKEQERIQMKCRRRIVEEAIRLAKAASK